MPNLLDNNDKKIKRKEMKKTNRMLIAESLHYVFTNNLDDKQKGHLTKVVEVIGDSLLIDIFSSFIFSLSPAKPVRLSNIITKITSSISSEYLFKLVEKVLKNPKNMALFLKIIRKKNNYIVSRMNDGNQNANFRLSLARLYIGLSNEQVASRDGVFRRLLAEKKKDKLVRASKKAATDCRAIIDLVVRDYASKVDGINIVAVPTIFNKTTYDIVVDAPEFSAKSYMHTAPRHVLCNKLAMNIDKDSAARLAMDKINNMSFTLDPVFNKIILDILYTDTFVKLIKGKSTDVTSIAAKTAQIRHSTAEGIKFWEESGSGEVYFEYVLDFRGRVNQIGGISAVGNKVGRSMLRSGKKYPLGEHGYNQLLMALASAAGKDKEIFQERLKWGKDNVRKFTTLGRLLQTDPKSGFMHLLREGVDDLFTAAAICLELDRIDSYHGAIRDYESNLLIGFDATSSAVQIVGLIMGNRTLTEASNVRVDSDTTNKIHDAYILMAASMDRAVESLKGNTNIENGDDFLDIWTGLPQKTKRAMAKPLLMTRLYGSKFLTHMRRCREVAVELGIFDVDHKDLMRFGVVIARLFNYAFDKEDGYNSLRAYEDFVKQVADAYSSKEKNVSWSVYSSMGHVPHQVLSRYFKFDGSAYRVYSDGKTHTSRTYNLDILGHCKEALKYEERLKLHKEKSKSAIAPNFIHSLDALVLYQTVLQMDCSLRLTHDCFAAPVGKAYNLQQLSAKVYADLFGDNNLKQLEKLQAECFENTGVLIELPPEYNRDGIPSSEIKNARYAFC